MGRFDLHFHPVFKKTITRFDADYTQRRRPDELTGEIRLSSGLMRWVDDEFIHFLESQCCIDQVNTGGVDLGVAAIAPMERLFTHRTGFAGKLLNGSLTDPLDKRYMEVVRDGTWSYYQLLVRELDQYRILKEGKKITLLSRKDAKTFEAKGLRLALGVEGGHALCRDLIGRTGQPDRVSPVPGQDPVWADFATNPQLTAAQSLEKFHAALWSEGLDLLYLTLTHLSHIGQQYLATHAYGMKMMEAPDAYPSGNGISQQGRDVVDAAYGMKDATTGAHTPVLIDIKHMGLKSRQDLYAYRSEKGYDKAPRMLPLLATHMGVTGYSLSDWKSNLVAGSAHWEDEHKAVGFTIDRCHAGDWGATNARSTFNGWSLNLMDEDIIEVLRSGGLIGLSLDVRVLGFISGSGKVLSKEDVEEFMSSEDFRHFFPAEYQRLFGAAGAPERWTPEESFLFPTKEERQPLQLCFNLLHILAVAQRAGLADAWEHVCIGSDFDGLIDPVKNCRNSGELNDLEKALNQWLPIAEEAYGKHRGSPHLLPRAAGNTVDKAAVKKWVDAILGGNGTRFMARWVNGEFK